MHEYKLDIHLKDFCSERPEYMNLYSTWNLNRKTCADALKSVVMNYPHFSMHDASHAETIISKIEMLLGNRILELSPTDTWLLLHAAYTHDLGMVLKWDEIEKVWGTPEFQNYLLELTNSTDNELRDASKFIKGLKENDLTLLWPLKTYRYVTLINAAYFRNQHAHISRKYIDVLGADLNIDLGHNNLIQSRLLKLLGQICELHTAPQTEMLKLNYQTDGFGSDYAHPRFVAMLLRLGDLLDIDNGRFNTVCELAVGGLPDTSVPHKEKHNATTHILVTPKEIQFNSNCSSSQAYLETRNFVTWLEAEVDFFTKYWAQIVPAGLGGYAPLFEKKEILINGIRDIQGIAGLRFEISQEKAFQIIEGSNIYKDRFVFVRELVQNAMDTSKIQMWNDVKSDTYRAWIGDKDFEKLQPQDLRLEIYQSYPIKIKLKTLADGLTEIEITDRGTGISIDAFKRMCNVGVSNSATEELRRSIQAMPNWLRPTAGFGVGLQSIFLLTDQFEIDTSTGSEVFHAVLHSNRAGGYLQLQQMNTLRARGTIIKILFQMPEQYSFSLSGDTENYLSLHFDPMSVENHIGEARILEAIKSNCENSIFPIEVECAEETLEPLELMKLLPICNINKCDDGRWKNWKNEYIVCLKQNESVIQIWDKKTATYGEFRMVMRSRSMTQVRFKGIEVEKRVPYLEVYGINGVVDIYGLDTKDTISLDRTSLTQYGRKETWAILSNMLEVYIECVLNAISSKNKEEQAKMCSSGDFNIYTFWLLCDSKQRTRIPKEMLKEIKEKVIVVVKENKGNYVKVEKDVSEVIPLIYEKWFLNLEEFKIYQSGSENINIDKICAIINESTGIKAEEIIADKELTREVARLSTKELQMPTPGNPMWLFTISKEEKTLVTATGNSKDEILCGLSAYIPGMNYSQYRSRPGKRYAIPALEEYADIAVDQVKYGISAPKMCGFHYIIAPFNREEADKQAEMSKEGFTEFVLASPTFSRVVEYVLEHSINRETITKEKVVAAYRRLIDDYYNVKHKHSASTLND